MKKIIFATLKVLGFFLMWGILVGLSSGSTLMEPLFLKNKGAFLRMWWELLPLIMTLITSAIFIKFVDKEKLKIQVFGSPIKDSIVGLIIGIFWIGSPTLILSIIGVMSFESKNTVSYLLIWIVAVLLNVIMQEYLIRGYVFQLLAQKFNLFVAITITTIVFTALHGGAFEAGIVAILNVLTMSAFVSLLLIYTKSLLAPIIVHFIWNAIGCLIFGSVSLADDYPSIFNCKLSANRVLSGGSAKMEGSIVVLATNLIFILVLIFMIKKDRKYFNKNFDNSNYKELK